jgi:hypothetical protein
MASTYSTNLALELIGTGDQAGTWGNTTNTNLGTLIEQAISGYETQALTSGTTLTLTIPNGASGVARNMYLEFTGTGSTVIVPSNKKLYFVYNNCSSGTITMKVAGQTGVTVANGAKQILVSNGTDIEEAISAGVQGITTTSVTAYGVNAGDSVTSGIGNTAVGHQAGTDVTSGNFNTYIGEYAGWKTTTGSVNTAVGRFSGAYGTTHIFCTYLGHGAGISRNSDYNVGVGHEALAGDISITPNTGTYNVAVGISCGDAVTSGSYNTLAGTGAGGTLTSGSSNAIVGYSAGGGITTGNNNSALGDTAYASGNYTNSTCIGYNSSVTGSNQVQLGNSSTTTYAYGAVQDRSDARDKTDIRDTQLGLDFILALRPRDFKWDMREDYRTDPPVRPQIGDYKTDAEYQAALEQWRSDYSVWEEANKLANITHNGTHTRTRYHQGLIAQEVKQTMDAMGVDFGGYQDHSIKGGDAILSIGYEELVAPLIKAIQELKAEFDEYKRTHP